MARIVLGNRDGALALTQARMVLSELSAEWPDVNIVPRTFRQGSGDPHTALLAALDKGAINMALVSLDVLPATLPEGLSLAAVTKRLEPRSALVAKGQKSIHELPAGAHIGVPSERDRAFLRAAGEDFEISLLSGALDNDLALLTTGQLDALVLPCATLLTLERRQRIDAQLEPEVFTPAVGQGSLGLVVREDDDLAFELAYTLQHRPSFDRVTAERSFQAALDGGLPLGALATVSSDGEMTLFGAVARPSANATLQATISGEASEAAELGRELAQDVLEQLKTLA